MNINMHKLHNSIKIEGNITFQFSQDTEANSWYVFCPELRLQSFAPTMEQAKTNILEVIAFTFEDLIKDGEIEEYIHSIGGKIIDNYKTDFAIKVIANNKEYIFLPESSNYITETTNHLNFDLV